MARPSTPRPAPKRTPAANRAPARPPAKGPARGPAKAAKATKAVKPGKAPRSARPKKVKRRSFLWRWRRGFFLVGLLLVASIAGTTNDYVTLLGLHGLNSAC